MSAIDVPSHVTAAILCGGLGTRLRSEVSDRPKFLAEVGGRPFAHYVLAGLAHVGVRQAVLCTGFLGDLVERTLGPAHAGIALSYSREDTPLGTGGALRAAEGLLRTPLVLALNGDSFCDADLRAMFAFHAARASFATMLLVRVEDPRRFGRVILDAEQRVVRFEEKSDDWGATPFVSRHLWRTKSTLKKTRYAVRFVSQSWAEVFHPREGSS